MRGPLLWFGGKGAIAKKIIPLMPLCSRYVEVFGGGASLLFARSPVDLEVYNDLDHALYDLFCVLSDPKKFKKFARRVSALPHSRQLWMDCKNTWRGEKDQVARAVKWYVLNRQSFGGTGGLNRTSGWGFSPTSSLATQTWISAVEGLPQIHRRLRRVQIECNDWRKVLDFYDSKETLFYLDPPYVPDLRRDGVYHEELNLEDHVELVDTIMGLQGSVALSGYWHEIHKPLDNSPEWARHDWKTVCFAAPRTRKTGLKGIGSLNKNQSRVESLWIKRGEGKAMKGFGL